jgi:hypothetical protein
MTGQPQWPGFTFDVKSMDVTEPTGAWAPATIIPSDQEFSLSCEFKMDGVHGQQFQDTKHGGQIVYEYDVTYYASVIGPGTSYKFPPTAPIRIPCIYQQYSYDKNQTSCTVPANTMNPGTYRLACVVKMAVNDPIPPVPPVPPSYTSIVTGFVEGPVIEISEPI